MKFNKISLALLLTSATMLTACDKPQTTPQVKHAESTQLVSSAQDRLDIYKNVALKTDLSALSDNQKNYLLN